MKITYISHVAFPDVVGDPFNSLELARRVSRLGHKVMIVAWNKVNSSLNRINNIDDVIMWKLAGINFRFNNQITDYPYIPNLNSILSQIKPDIVHIHSHLFLTSLQAIRFCINQKKPSIVSVHGVMAKRHKLVNLMQEIYLLTIASYIFKKATVIHCLTRNDASEIMKLGCPINKIKIIPNAVDVETFTPRPELEEDKSIVWVGRFVPEKGLHYLINASRVVVQRHPDAKFILVGNGVLRWEIQQMVMKYGLSRNFFFTGSVSRKKVLEILQSATLFVFPSLKEGMPIALLEAMSCAKPVIGSDISGINDIIVHGENGFLVPPRNPEALAKTIMMLLEDKDTRRKIGQNARKLVMEKYSWNVILKKIEKLYYEVAKLNCDNHVIKSI